MSIINTSKTSAASFLNTARHNAAPMSYPKGGLGWAYNQGDYTYDQLLDPLTHDQVFYDSVGFAQSWSNQAKHAA